MMTDCIWIQLMGVHLSFQTCLNFTFSIYSPIPEKEPMCSEESDRKEKKTTFLGKESKHTCPPDTLPNSRCRFPLGDRKGCHKAQRSQYPADACVSWNQLGFFSASAAAAVAGHLWGLLAHWQSSAAVRFGMRPSPQSSEAEL